MEPLAAHRLWAATYDRAPNPLLALEQRILAPLLPPLDGHVVIDVACGTGRWSRLLAVRGALVVGTDRCPEMLARARGPLVMADAAQLPIRTGAADLVLCAFALAYLPPCLAELARIVRPGGTVIVSDVHPAAVERGWTRSFRTSSDVVAIRARRYTLDTLHAPGLSRLALVEASLGEPERPIFELAGKPAKFREACCGPAIFVAKWVRE